MVIDTSALLAILFDEEDASLYARAIAEGAVRYLSAASWLEASIVIEARYGLPGGQALDQLVQTAEIHIEPVTFEQIKVAREAYRRFGKGRGHAAGLNYGDCFAYALAKIMGEPLLFKGDDFRYTDIGSVR